VALQRSGDMLSVSVSLLKPGGVREVCNDAGQENLQNKLWDRGKIIIPMYYQGHGYSSLCQHLGSVSGICTINTIRI